MPVHCRHQHEDWPCHCIRVLNTTWSCLTFFPLASLSSRGINLLFFLSVLPVPQARFLILMTVQSSLSNHRSSHQRCFMEKGVLRNSAKFTGKHLCQSFFFNKGTGVFLWILRNFEEHLFTEHLWTTASVIIRFSTFPKSLPFRLGSGKTIFYYFISHILKAYPQKAESYYLGMFVNQTVAFACD